MSQYQSLFERKKIPLTGNFLQLGLLLILVFSLILAAEKLSTQYNQSKASLATQEKEAQLIQRAATSESAALLTKPSLLEKTRIHLGIIRLLERHPGVRLVALNQPANVKKKQRTRRIRRSSRAPKKKQSKPTKDPTKPWVTRLPNQAFTMHQYTFKVMGQYRQLILFMQDFLKQHHAIVLDHTEISAKQFPMASLQIKFQYFTTEQKEPSA